MSSRANLKGRRFGKLRVLAYAGVYQRPGGKDGRYAKWLCECTCGRQTEVISSNLLRHHTKSCGQSPCNLPKRKKK